ncbi:phage tail protein [Plastoroseomonas hellenica]|uniref:phage tail protein n=1 Tax=Plastoroseomonas hellenica TaxID=2687306 RepID=UPI0020139BF7|nr:tail fiber protein [Plastoroseomonas hellenica]MBR0643977.1 hypothetical protein [Plastoroseomonas hellenica]
MWRVDDVGSVGSMPTPPPAGARGWFRDGVGATQLRAWWLNLVQGLLENTVLAAGLVPSKTDLTLLTSAMRRLGGHVGIIVANTTTLNADRIGVVPVDATTGDITITLAPANSWATRATLVRLQRLDFSDHVVTVQRAGADFLGGPGLYQFALQGGAAVDLVSNGVNGWGAWMATPYGHRHAIADIDGLQATLGTLGNATSQALDMFVGFSFNFNGAALPPGFLWEDGANHSRVTYAKLFAAIGTRFGPGDGVNTFAVPDSRGRIDIGRDDMGGVAAGRVTSGGSGIAANTLGAAGGSQYLQAHAHGVSDPGHAHAIADPGHSHGVNDPGHAHTAWTDAQGHHDHALPQSIAAYGLTGGNGGLFQHTGLNGSYRTEAGGSHGHNVGIGGAGTGIWLNGSGTGIGIYGALTSLGIQNAGAGGSQNMPPAIVRNRIIFTGVFS